jgi:FixJ family two-component response regulator
MSNHADHVVYVVDSDTEALAALARMLEGSAAQIVTAKSVDEFVALYRADSPGCIVIDIRLPGLRQKQTQLLNLGSAIIFTSDRADIATAVAAMKDGAADFLAKPVTPSVLIEAVRSATRGRNLDRVTKDTQAHCRQMLEQLSSRELEVLAHVIRGQLNTQIAAELGISARTVKSHRARVRHKLNVRSIAELARIAMDAGLNWVPRTPVSQCGRGGPRQRCAVIDWCKARSALPMS